jgi:mono/diheme cytochrome c family protein
MRALATCLLLVACADAPLPIDDYPCPPEGTQLTYESFGARFLSTHCNDCHNANEGRRHGAPESYRFETLEDVRRHRSRVFVRSAASNTTMPPGPEDPDPDDRERLAEWLACGAP